MKKVIGILGVALLWCGNAYAMSSTSAPAGLTCPDKAPDVEADYVVVSGKVLESSIKEYPVPAGITISAGVFLRLRMMASFDDTELGGEPREIYVRSTEIMPREKMTANEKLPVAGKYYTLCVRPILKSQAVTSETKEFRVDNLQQIIELQSK